MDNGDQLHLNILRTLLRAELEQVNKENEELKLCIKEKAQNVRKEIARRRSLKAEIAKNEERLRIINNANDKIRQNINYMKYQLRLAEAGEDIRTKTTSIHLEEYKKVLNKFQETWAQYEAQYEELPLAKVRQESRLALEKAQKEKEELLKKIDEEKRNRIQMSHTNWEKARGKIIEFAKEWLDCQRHSEKLDNTRTKNVRLREEVKSLEAELKALQEKEAELNKEEKTKISLPDIDNIFVKPTVAVRTYQKGMQKKLKFPRTVSSETLISINSSMLEKMCISLEEAMKNNDAVIDKQNETENASPNRKEQKVILPNEEEQEKSITEPTPMEEAEPEHMESQLSKLHQLVINSNKEEEMDFETVVTKKQHPEITSIEKSNVKIRVIKAGGSQENQINTIERTVNDKHVQKSHDQEILHKESAEVEQTSVESQAPTDKRKVLPEFEPHENEPEAKKIAIASDNAGINITERPKSMTSIEKMEIVDKKNKGGNDNSSSVLTTLRNSIDSNLLNTDVLSRADSATRQDSIYNLKLSDCSFISRFGDDNTVDTSSICDDCVNKQTDNDKIDNNKDDDTMEFGFDANFHEAEVGKFKLF